jgi:DUF1707 SHOCT-like domain
MDAQDPARLRISDHDRHQVAEILREAAGEGRIDLSELDERLEATYAARTYADLVPITHDLPASATAHLPERPPAPTPAPVVAGPAEERHLAVLSGIERKGVWVVPQHLTISCFMGGADLDLRQAKFSAHEVVITIYAVMGGADIKVNPQTHVIMEGSAFMGGYSGPDDRHSQVEIDEHSHVVRLRGFAIMGGVNVDRKPVRGSRRRLDRGSP